ncbi:MAG TPA: M56 family metallopeptidase [Candidatus Sulfotelmatobacter sp.]|nr:M56 family metallopeptidase [Candidatus Sulfotelmatobacter sp.]
MIATMIAPMTATMNASAAAMTSSLVNWVSPGAMQSLGWALLHFLWQGTALAALAAVAMALCGRASTRYLLGVGALALMFLAPLATFFFYLQGHSSVADTAKSSPLAAVAWPTARDRAAASGSTQSSPIAPSRELLPWMVEAWLLGVAFFSLRSAGGFFLLEREWRKQSSVVGPRMLEICYTLQDKIGLDRAISYFECEWLQAPAVIGWFRPIVFLPVTALTGLSEGQLESVIAHELAHIKRFDPFVNVFQICVESLLFYHPAVWWLNKKVRAEREHCCDEMAVNLCGNPVEYARALTLMEEWRSAPVFAMAANRGPLTERILRVLGLKTLGAGMRGIGLTGSILCLTAALAAGNALVGMAHPSSAHAIFNGQATSQAAPTSAQQPSAKPAPTSKPSAAQSAKPAPAASSSSSSSYIDSMKATGLGDLSLDELIAMKIQGVTPDYVREIREQGLTPDANNLIAMRVQGITPEYVRGLHASGLNPDVNQIIALKVQGADAEYYRGLKEAGLQPDIDRLIALKVQGVTPDYVRELRAAGLTVNADQVIALKVQGVSPSYLKGLHEQGIEPTADNAIAMRVQDVTPEYVRDIRALGLNPSTNDLIAMRVQDVTPEYIKGLQAAGFKLNINEIIGAKVQDVTPEFIEQARKHGFKDLTLQKLIQLRQLGILDSKSDI